METSFYKYKELGSNLSSLGGFYQNGIFPTGVDSYKEILGKVEKEIKSYLDYEKCFSAQLETLLNYEIVSVFRRALIDAQDRYNLSHIDTALYNLVRDFSKQKFYNLEDVIKEIHSNTDISELKNISLNDLEMNLDNTIAMHLYNKFLLKTTYCVYIDEECQLVKFPEIDKIIQTGIRTLYLINDKGCSHEKYKMIESFIERKYKGLVSVVRATSHEYAVRKKPIICYTLPHGHISLNLFDQVFTDLKYYDFRTRSMIRFVKESDMPF